MSRPELFNINSTSIQRGRCRTLCGRKKVDARVRYRIIAQVFSYCFAKARGFRSRPIRAVFCARCTDYDQLVVSADARRNGTLDVDLLTAAFVPTIGQQFDLITTAGTIDGQFDSLDLPQFAGGFNLVWDLQYGLNVLRLELLDLIAGLPGDYNQNGTVDAADYVVWRKNEGTSSSLPNDPIGGVIGPAQYAQWRANFGQTAGSGSAMMANAAVPEPATLIACLIAMAGSFLSQGRPNRTD